MDDLERSIKLGLHVTKNPMLINKTWDDFINAAHGKKIIFYGVTATLQFFWIRCSDEFNIAAAIDGDLTKQGLPLN